MMRCERCGNTDPSWFYHGSRGWYCRKCISFGRALIEEDRTAVSLQPVQEGSEEYTLKYPLTADQEKLTLAVMDCIEETDVLIHAVTGAGKTELAVGPIAMMLKKGKKVCFAIARRQVVLELGVRLSEIFTNAKVVSVCGGHTSELDGDLIVCTTHQLYRYEKAFDLLVLDEPDAFPYHGDPVLHGIAASACRGHVIYLTATPDEELMGRVKDGSLRRFCLNSRPHGHPVPVPVIHACPFVLRMYYLFDFIVRNADHPRMIFVPTIRMAEMLCRFLSLFFECSVCTSKTEERDEVIADFASKKNGLILCTTVLERGVTIPDAQILVLQADHGVFDEASLIQMAGRAGRNFKHPEGEVMFLLKEKAEAPYACRRSIEEANRSCGA